MKAQLGLGFKLHVWHHRAVLVKAHGSLVCSLSQRARKQVPVLPVSQIKALCKVMYSYYLYPLTTFFFFFKEKKKRGMYWKDTKVSQRSEGSVTKVGKDRCGNNMDLTSWEWLLMCSSSSDFQSLCLFVVSNLLEWQSYWLNWTEPSTPGSHKCEQVTSHDAQVCRMLSPCWVLCLALFKCCWFCHHSPMSYVLLGLPFLRWEKQSPERPRSFPKSLSFYPTPNLWHAMHISLTFWLDSIGGSWSWSLQTAHVNTLGFCMSDQSPHLLSNRSQSHVLTV